MPESLDNYPSSQEETTEQQDVGESEIPLSERQQRVLRCLQCLEDPLTKEVIGTQQIEDCAKLTKPQKMHMLMRLTQKGAVNARRIDPNEAPLQEPWTRSAYSITVRGGKTLDGTSKSCPYSRDKYPRSTNPYIGAKATRKEVLDCIRCLSAQERTISPLHIALCTGRTDMHVRVILDVLKKQGALHRGKADSPNLLSSQAKRSAIYGPSEQSKDYLTPVEMPDCSIIEKEAERIIATRSAATLGVLACLSCQHQKVVSGEQWAVNTGIAVNCTGKAYVNSFVRNFIAADFLESVAVSPYNARYLAATKAGRILFDALRDAGYQKDQCQVQGMRPHDDKAYAKTIKQISRCVTCITDRQRLKGMDVGVTATMIAQCLNIGETFVSDKLPAMGFLQKHYRAPRNTAIFTEETSLVAQSSPDRCSYNLPVQVAGIDAGEVPLPGAEHAKNQQRPAEVLSKLGIIIQESRDFNEVRLAVRALFDSKVGDATYQARRYSRFNDVPPRDELEQVALISLLKAAERWNPAGTGSFSSFAKIVLRNQLSIAIAEHREQTRHVYVLIDKISKTRASFWREHQRPATTEDLIELLKGVAPAISVKRAIEANNRRQALLAAQPYEQQVETLTDAPSQPSAKIDDYSETNQRIMRLLNDRERILYRELILRDTPQEVVAEQMNISQTQVSRLRKRFTQRLGHPSIGLLADITPKAYGWMDDAHCYKQGRIEFSETWSSSMSQECQLCPVKQNCRDLYDKIGTAEGRGTWGGESAKSI